MPLPKPPTRPAVFLSAQAVEETNQAPRAKPRGFATTADAVTAHGRRANRATRRRARARGAGAAPRAEADAPGAGVAVGRHDVRAAAAREGAGRRGQAVRARHERADARPVGAVPLRGARRLPADDDARGARQPQEGHVRSRAQRAPGQPLARRAGQQHCDDDATSRTASRCPSSATRTPSGKLFFQTACDDADAAVGAAGRQGRQPDPRPSCAATAGAAHPSRGRAGVEGHQHAHQGACAGPAGRGLLQRPGPRRHRPAVLPASRSCRPTSGTRTARASRAGSRTARRRCTASRVRSCRAAGQRVRLPRRRRRGAVLRAGQGDQRQDRRAARRCATTATRRTASGASPPATASRTSR